MGNRLTFQQGKVITDISFTQDELGFAKLSLDMEESINTDRLQKTEHKEVYAWETLASLVEVWLRVVDDRA